MTIYSCTVADMIEERWTAGYMKRIFKFRKKLYKSNTYMLIFGPAQDAHRKWFLAQPGINILYVSKKAINNRYHKTQKRNTLVIFEKADTPPVESPSNLSVTSENVPAI
jgi:hypothetical protein